MVCRPRPLDSDHPVGLDDTLALLVHAADLDASQGGPGLVDVPPQCAGHIDDMIERGWLERVLVDDGTWQWSWYRPTALGRAQARPLRFVHDTPGHA